MANAQPPLDTGEFVTPDEVERLRRIEAAARAYLDAEWDADRAYAEDALRKALAKVANQDMVYWMDPANAKHFR